MLVCAKCGAVRKGNQRRKSRGCRSEGCTGYEIETTQKLKHMVELFYALDYAIVSGKEKTHTIDRTRFLVAQLSFEFEKNYKVEAFPELPQPWEFYGGCSGDARCQLIYRGDYGSGRDKQEVKYEIERIMLELRNYIQGLEDSGRTAIAYLAHYLY